MPGKQTRKQIEEQRVRERRNTIRRLSAGEVSPEEKVRLYLEGEFFFPDVVEIRATREIAEKSDRIDNRGLVELDGRLWYVDLHFNHNIAQIKGAEQRREARKARTARSGHQRRIKP